MPNEDITYIQGYHHKKIEDLYDYHSKFEKETKERLEGLGCFVEAAPYHKTFAIPVQSALHKNFGMTASYIRSRSDRVIVHKQTSFTCQLEIKTPRYEHENIYLEALPLAIHLYTQRVGVKTLYMYHDPFHGLSVAFWASDEILPHIQEIKIPAKSGLNPEQYEKKFRQILGDKMPPVKLSDSPNKRGSGDPYAVIDLPALLQKNLDLSLILRKAIGEYLIEHDPRDPVLCPSCRKNIDFSKLKSTQDKWKLLDEIAIHCDECASRFCSRTCYQAHRPQQKSRPEKQQDLAGIFFSSP